MAGGRSLSGVLAGAGPGAGVPGLLGLLLAMEAGVPVPVPSDLATLLLARRRGRAARVLAEGACPACLALGLRRP